MANRLLLRLLSTQTKQLIPSTHQQPQHHLSLPPSVISSLESIVDPFQLLASELGQLKQNISALVGSDHHQLNSIANYYLASPQQGKHLRPLVILLIAQATTTTNTTIQSVPINQAISPTEILNDINPTQPFTNLSSNDNQTLILPTQRRLAEIAELIHVSSLLHDDVIDQAESRRGRPSAPREFGSKLAVLAGDFLLARASLSLSRLANFQVIELISSIISNLVQGELLQLDSILNLPPHQSSSSSSSSSPPPGAGATSSPHSPPPATFDDRLFAFYKRKNYLKTASLIAKTSRATVLLSPSACKNQSLIEASYEYGKHLGLAFQIVDDILDYTGSDEALGKAANSSDLKAGLVTGPGLFAWRQYPETFGELVSRKFSHPGDLDLACEMVKKSDGINQSYQLAEDHLRQCKSNLDHFEDSDSKQGLYRLCDLVLNRNR